MAATLLPYGYEYTVGNQIVDASGDPVRINAINWFGLEGTNFAPGGLDTQSMQTIMNEIVSMGFNTIRLPFSNQLFNAGSNPVGINYTLNPDLKGLVGIELMDAIVNYAGQIGLKVILDDHRSSAGSGPNDNGLWYADGYTQAQWVADWQGLAQHYAGNPTVIGADLANEPHDTATWGGPAATNWAAAATTAADAIQAINPNWLMFVQGVQTYNAQSTWWGSNLEGVATDPITLTVPDHVVYEVHEYPPSVGWQPDFGAANYPQDLPADWTAQFGYIYQQNIAPVFVGEFGSKLQTTADQQYISTLVAYLDGYQTGTGQTSDVPAGGEGISWGYWSLNPDSGDTGGVLGNNWLTVNTAVLAAVAPAFDDTPAAPLTSSLSTGTASTTSAGTASATATVTATTATSATASTTATTTTTAAPVLTVYNGGAAGSAAISLGDGNWAVAVGGFNDTVTLGNGESQVGEGVVSPLGNADITVGNGNEVVTAFGVDDVITGGTGNDVVVGPQGNAHVTLGAGDQVVVLFGTANTVSVGDTANPADTSQATLINAGSGNDTVTAGDGTVFVLVSGQGDIVTTGTTGTANSRAFVFLSGGDGNATITTGAGDDWIVLAGQNNVVDGGLGGNVIYAGAGNDRYVLHQGGTDYLYGFGSTDRLDLSQALAGDHVTADLATLSRFIQITSSGGNSTMSLDPTGQSSFTSAPVAMFSGESGLTLASLQQQGGLLLPST